MSTAEDTSSVSGDRCKGRHVMFMHPGSCPVDPARNFLPFGWNGGEAVMRPKISAMCCGSEPLRLPARPKGSTTLLYGRDVKTGQSKEREQRLHCLLKVPQRRCTPPENLLENIPKDAERADMLLFGCSDARHALYTLWKYASEFNRKRREWNAAGVPQRDRKPDGLQTLRFTLHDREPACLARVLLLLQLFLDSGQDLLAACKPSAPPKAVMAYVDRIALCFNANYNVYVDKHTQAAVQTAAIELLELSSSPEAWRLSDMALLTHISGDTLDRLRAMWFMYADTSIVDVKPKATLDRERRAYHHDHVKPQKNMSARLLHGDGPGVAAELAADWTAEMTGVHRQYQTWGYVDPFEVLRGRTYSPKRFYTKPNPAMIATDHQELDFQLDPTCNPFQAFHLDRAWLGFRSPATEAGESGKLFTDDPSSEDNPLSAGPPSVPWETPPLNKRAHFGGGPEDAMHHLRSKLMLVTLEQLSRMCWAVNWYRHEVSGSDSICVDRRAPNVRLNFILGDPVDTCDAICCLSSEGMAASSASRKGNEPASRVWGAMPRMSLRPFRLDRSDLDGPARFDFIDSAHLSHAFGMFNLITAASPLLKPYPHVILRTDLKRTGVAPKHACPVKLAAPDQSMVKSWAEIHAFVTEEDWFTAQAQTCAMLLGLAPVRSAVSAVGCFDSMLEAATMAKTNPDNDNVGDLGQRLRIVWKHACFLDPRSGAYLLAKDRAPLTLHPRVALTPEKFSSMMLPFWMYMNRGLYHESDDCPHVGEGDDRQLRISPYTPASFARLMSHSSRFLKLDRSHVLKVLADLHRNFSEGLFGANVVDQLDAYVHLLALCKNEAMNDPDVVRWTRQCPSWVRKPPPEGTVLVPAGSPGACRVVMIASPEAAKIVRQLRNPALCVILEDYSSEVRNLVSALHCCFVRVHRASGSFPEDDVDGDPWFVVSDRWLRVQEARPDDPEAELMVSFLFASATLINAKMPKHVELELRLQDMASRHIASSAVAGKLSASKGVIYRTNLSQRRDTAVIFPSKSSGVPMLQRWVSQSIKWDALVQDDKGRDAGLGPRRVGKMDRYVITPCRPQLRPPGNRVHNLQKPSIGGWANLFQPEGADDFFSISLDMSNPAARQLLADTKTKVTANSLSELSFEIVFDAPERANMKGKKKRRAGAGELGKGGIDGGFRYIYVLPYPMVYVRVVDKRSTSVELHALLAKSTFVHPMASALQTVDAEAGRKLSQSLPSSWALPTRCMASDMRLKRSEQALELLNVTMEQVSARHESGVVRFCMLLCSFASEHESCRLLEINYANQDLLESDESLLLDVLLLPLGPVSNKLRGALADAGGGVQREMDDGVIQTWEKAIPGAVERGRHTYSHSSSCSYPGCMPQTGYPNETGLFCPCSAGKDIADMWLPAGLHPDELKPWMHRAVLPISLFAAAPEKKTRCIGPSQTSCRKVPMYKGPSLAYTGPDKDCIIEVGSAGTVGSLGGGSNEQGSPVGCGSRANGNGGNGILHRPSADEVDPETAEVLKKAGLRAMPKTSADWIKFERVKEGQPPEEPCGYCLKASAPKRCTRCKNIKYCSKTCQSKHWTKHKANCYILT